MTTRRVLKRKTIRKTSTCVARNLRTNVSTQIGVEAVRKHGVRKVFACGNTGMLVASYAPQWWRARILHATGTNGTNILIDTHPLPYRNSSSREASVTLQVDSPEGSVLF